MLPDGGRRNWKGIILRVDDDQDVVLDVDGQEQVIRLSEVERANLVPEL